MQGKVRVACSVGVPVRVESGLRTCWNGISAIPLATGDSGLLKVDIVDSDSDSGFGILARKPYVVPLAGGGFSGVCFRVETANSLESRPMHKMPPAGRLFCANTCFTQGFLASDPLRLASLSSFQFVSRF